MLTCALEKELAPCNLSFFGNMLTKECKGNMIVSKEIKSNGGRPWDFVVYASAIWGFICVS